MQQRFIYSPFVVIAFLLIGLSLQAQVAEQVTIQNQTITSSNSEEERNPVASQSITILPNSWIQAGTDFSARIMYDPYITPVLTQTENYVFTRVFQSPITQTQLEDPDTGISHNVDVIESITYFDGLGRPKQQIGIKASDDKKDLVTHIRYDEYGRQDKQYLPFESQGVQGNYKTVSINTDINTYYQNKYAADFSGMAVGDVNAYSESIFEDSPLNRVLEQGAPGKDWKADKTVDTDHTIKFDWSTNIASEVVYFKVDFPVVNGISDTESPTLVKDGFYTANELLVTITKDENWQPGQTHLNDHTTKEYKDKLGRVVLKRTFNNGISHDTYYIYDDFGNLTYVIPPKVTLSASDGVSPEELTELCYQYKYDHRNRLVEKKIPGKGWEYIVYNKLDQPIMTQDANQRNNNEWLFTSYDAFGRVAYTGIDTNNTKTRTEVQAEADAVVSQFVTKTTSANIYTGTTIYYNKGSVYPNSFDEILTINYYDNYTFDGSITNPGTVYGQTIASNTKGLATAAKVRVLGTSFWISTITYYDQKGRPIYLHSTNEFLNTTDIAETQLDFVGKVVKTKTTHTKDANPAIVTIDTFTYDHMGRLLTQVQQIDNQPKEQIVSNTYDELGQLVSKNVGGSVTANGSEAVSSLQKVDYTYNVRGWLKTINNDSHNDNDLFDFAINYNTTEKSLGAANLYNGNISETIWKTANDNTERAYGYQYDALNRITVGLDNTPDKRYSLNSIGYDKNGNIINLTRKGQTNSNATSFGTMDQLSYTYNDGNQLESVTDNSNITEGFNDGNRSGNDYLYDDNGNMTMDKNKNITDIQYNHLNLPTRVTVRGTSGVNNTIEYTYDATGVKLRKLVNEYPNLTTTQYAGNYVYKSSYSLALPPGPNNSDALVLEFLNQPEGYIEPVIASGSEAISSFEYIYQYKDHLGNIRLSYSDKDKDGKIDVLRNNADLDGDGDHVMEIREEKNYYPFGLKHKGYNNVINGTDHPYGFVGKEENEELGLNWLDFGARNYSPDLGRWMNLDPLAETMPEYSPYTYAFNNPIYFLDPDGERPCPNGDCGGAVVAVFFHGGPTGGGKTTTADKAGGTGRIYNNTQAAAQNSGREFKGTVIAPGFTSASGVNTAMEFIKENFSSGDQVIVYGYSYGVDVAVDFTEALKEAGIDVDLLVTVDGSDGPLQNTTVNTDIPDNVDTNLNIYQDDDSGNSNASPGSASGSASGSSSGPSGSASGSSSGSSSGTSSGSSGSSSGSSNSPGSNGGPNSPVNGKKTNVINKNISGKGVTHGNIQDKAKNIIQPLINTRIYNYQNQQ